MLDVAIIGGGPVGAAVAALAAGSGLRIEVFEALVKDAPYSPFYKSALAGIYSQLFNNSEDEGRYQDALDNFQRASALAFDNFRNNPDVPDFQNMEDVERCGALIVESAARPITIGNREINVTVSIGACIYPDYGLEADQLLKNADAAMYVVKDRGRNGLHILTTA